jgi:hypothetical protein
MMSKDTQGAFKRWEMTSFGDERPSSLAARIQAEERAAAAPLWPRPQPPRPIPTNPAMHCRPRPNSKRCAKARAPRVTKRVCKKAARPATPKPGSGPRRSAGRNGSLRAIAATFSQAVTAADETIASDVLDLALHLARSMVRTAFDRRPELIIPIVREAIDYLPVLQAAGHPGPESRRHRDRAGRPLRRTGQGRLARRRRSAGRARRLQGRYRQQPDRRPGQRALGSPDACAGQERRVAG